MVGRFHTIDSLPTRSRTTQFTWLKWSDSSMISAKRGYPRNNRPGKLAASSRSCSQSQRRGSGCEDGASALWVSGPIVAFFSTVAYTRTLLHSYACDHGELCYADFPHLGREGKMARSIRVLVLVLLALVPM